MYCWFACVYPQQLLISHCKYKCHMWYTAKKMKCVYSSLAELLPNYWQNKVNLHSQTNKMIKCYSFRIYRCPFFYFEIKNTLFPLLLPLNSATLTTPRGEAHAQPGVPAGAADTARDVKSQCEKSRHTDLQSGGRDRPVIMLPSSPRGKPANEACNSLHEKPTFRCD